MIGLSGRLNRIDFIARSFTILVEVAALDKTEKHEIISALKQCASILGHAPSRNEYREKGIGPSSAVIERVFGGWSPAIIAAGLQSEVIKVKAPKFRYKKTTIDSFHLHIPDLGELFKAAGNPPFLKGIFMPDTHMKHHDKAAMSVFLQCVELFQPHIFTIMGDFIDAVGISHWPTDELEPRRLVPEIIEARECLKAISARLSSSVARFYLEGNHEDWIRQAMVAKLPELFDGLEELDLLPDLEKLLDLEKFGFDLIPLNHLLKIGKAHFTHGLYVAANHPKTHLDKVKGNIYYGHLHDDRALIDTGIEGPVEAASLACLCRLDAPFMKGKPTNWRHGFGAFWFFPDGTFIRHQVRIDNGRCTFEGKLIVA